MIHFYTSRSYRKGYRLACTETYVKSDLSHAPVSYPKTVTCPACLEKIIPREIAKLERLQHRLAEIRAGQAVVADTGAVELVKNENP